jgi:hypothetical protein
LAADVVRNTHTAAVFFGLVLFLGWLAFTIISFDKRIPELAFLSVGLGPVVIHLVLSMAQGFRAAAEPPGDDPFAQTAPAVNWELRDPSLSTFGLWRARVECHPPDIDRFKNYIAVRDQVNRVVRSWSVRTAWPCEVVRVSRAKWEKTSVSGALSKEKAYRITLVDQWNVLRGAWIRFGDGFVEFQVEAVQSQEVPAIDTAGADESKQLVTMEFP